MVTWPTLMSPFELMGSSWNRVTLVSCKAERDDFYKQKTKEVFSDLNYTELDNPWEKKTSLILKELSQGNTKQCHLPCCKSDSAN